MNEQAPLACDVCIIGAGPAGLTLAGELARSGHSTVVLESGPAVSQELASPLNAGTVSGDIDWDLRNSRARGVGGTSMLWSTTRDDQLGAKYLPLESIDLERRELTPFSGWPIGHRDLDSWYARARTVCGLPQRVAATQHPTSQARHLIPFADGGLVSRSYQWGSNVPFVGELPNRVTTSPNAKLVPDATVVGFKEVGPAGTLTAVSYCSPSSSPSLVEARRIVLAAGAIENARLLLVLYRDLGRTPPDWLGRGFMEHPIDRSLTLTTRHPALSPTAGFYAFAGEGRRRHLIGHIGLSREMLVRYGLRNALIRLFPDRHPRARRTLRRVAHWIGRTPETRYRILLDLEQAPHPDNRVTLAQTVDRFGMPHASLHWRWRPSDEQNRQAVLLALREEFERAGAGRLDIGAAPPLETDVHHHSGTTRMSTNRDDGVVDPHLRVHDFTNLFVTGASVFPTAGAANPMLTIVALSLRLADHLTKGGAVS